MSLEYYVIGCVLAGVCGLASGIIAACCWIAGCADRKELPGSPDITAEDLR